MQAMPRLREVPRDEADPFVRQIYRMLFGERDPVREPGTETGSPGNWWTVFAESHEMHATICRALRLEYDDIDERVTEVAAPGGAAVDVMHMVDS